MAVNKNQAFFLGGSVFTNFLVYWWWMQRNRAQKKWGAMPTCYRFNFCVLLAVFPTFSVFKVVYPFCIFCCQSCRSPRNVSKGLNTVDKVGWRHQRATFQLCLDPPNPKSTTTRNQGGGQSPPNFSKTRLTVIQTPPPDNINWLRLWCDGHLVVNFFALWATHCWLHITHVATSTPYFAHLRIWFSGKVGTIDLLCFPWQPRSTQCLQGPDEPSICCFICLT